MTDHIVVFDGNERLIGCTIPVRIDEATAFTLFGTVVTGEQVGVETERLLPTVSCADSAGVNAGSAVPPSDGRVERMNEC